MKFLNSNYILTEFLRGGRKVPFSNKDMKAHINSEVKKILKTGQKTFTIALLRIKNRSVKFPEDFYKITQALYLPDGEYFFNERKEKSLINKGITLDKCLCKKPDKANYDYKPDYEVKYTLQDYTCDSDCILDLIFNPSFLMYNNVQVAYVGDQEQRKQNNVAYIMRPQTNNYSNLQYHISECFKVNLDSTITYDVIDDTHMTVNMKDGYVLLSYLSNKVDDEGYLLIPDDPFVQDALVTSLNLKVAEFNRLRNPSNQYLNSIFKDYFQILPSKMIAAEKQMKIISKDKLDLILEKWDRRENDSPINDYQSPENTYPDY